MTEINSSRFSAVAAVSAIILALSIASARAVADDQAGYESLSDVTIGHVFFSPKQRLSLDRRRQGRPDRAPPNARRKTRLSDDSAGFIVNSAGKTKIYTNGDFVASAATISMDFPGDVAIARRKTSTQADDSDVEPSDADD